MTSKPAYKSKTIQGATFLLISYVFSFFNRENIEIDISEVVTSISVVSAYIYTVYGRYKAKEPISSIINDIERDII